MTPFIGEFIGTFLLIILGNGVVANVVLGKTYGHNSGWIVITLAWGMAVFVGVYVAAPYSGAHINPAVTFGLAVLGAFPWSDVPLYVVAQLTGAFTGAVMCWLSYRLHFNETEDPNLKLGVFCTAPAIPSTLNNLVTEAIGTFILVFCVLFIVGPTDASGESFKLGALDALPVALLVLAIGLCLGGATGYAINPARDLGPRIAHFILPIPGKRDSNWGYSWIPIVGPLGGSFLAAIAYKIVT